jgi:hypothetical protein
LNVIIRVFGETRTGTHDELLWHFYCVYLEAASCGPQHATYQVTSKPPHSMVKRVPLLFSTSSPISMLHIPSIMSRSTETFSCRTFPRLSPVRSKYLSSTQVFCSLAFQGKYSTVSTVRSALVQIVLGGYLFSIVSLIRQRDEPARSFICVSLFVAPGAGAIFPGYFLGSILF